MWRRKLADVLSRPAGRRQWRRGVWEGGLAKANQKTRNSICFVSREVSGGVGGLKVFFKMALEAQALEKKKEREIGVWGGGKGGVTKKEGAGGREGGKAEQRPLKWAVLGGTSGTL